MRKLVLVLWIINGIWAQCVVNEDNEMECSKAIDTIQVPSGDLRAVTVVTITNSKFKSLNKEVLKPLTSMEYVYFIGNNIGDIEPDTFSEFTQIKELLFTQNTISRIDFGGELKTVDLFIFEDNIITNKATLVGKKLRNVKRLHLGNNDMKKLDWMQGDFARLIVLNVPNNRLRTLPSDFSSRVKLLQYLDLQDNLFTSIDNTMFKGLYNLIDLRLANNNISHIADFAFADLSNLISLTLRNNSITSITKDTFKGLHSLESLSLTENRLDDISKDAFQNVPAIKELHLHENTITSLEVGTFRNLNKLVGLDISNNYNTEWKPGMFKNLQNIIRIKLRRNDVEEIKTGTFVNLPALELIDIAYNQIKTIQDDAFDTITYLKELNLMHNEISVWNPKAFKNVEKIGKINLEGNQII
ncbi:leucine-rich repeat-containing G-protein coupled receptor 4-like isoform X2 [Photinus pyralis]|uniref:leucine-rich repeat-containing G-protein coupled receptor 4-like isoform X2 n=1 Tax=Photinus pyralis TaxID=7054 RepID=UPI0012671BA8|nr:leucine-rich repeat-containing G-protein coupled receptor 4-like isoform X2 [Photinus pyralis]